MPLLHPWKWRRVQVCVTIKLIFFFLSCFLLELRSVFLPLVRDTWGEKMHIIKKLFILFSKVVYSIVFAFFTQLLDPIWTFHYCFHSHPLTGLPGYENFASSKHCRIAIAHKFRKTFLVVFGNTFLLTFYLMLIWYTFGYHRIAFLDYLNCLL